MFEPTGSGLFYRRNLPHIVPGDKPLYVTATTFRRWRLPPPARTLALRHSLHDHLEKIFMHVAVIMPDHMHLIFELIRDRDGHVASLAEVMKGIKGVSSRRINQLLHRAGTVWLDESFDHVLRLSERSRQKYEYVCLNPVRAGLVKTPDEYPWLWRSWVEGRAGWSGRRVSGTDKSVCAT